MLLGRNANGLYWMNRYIERAENMARLVDAGLRMALTRTQDASEEWNSVLLSAGSDLSFSQKHHEYTAANVKFALTIEPDNAALKARAEEVARQRAANQPTIPTLLAEEKKANVFLRADVPQVAANLGMSGKGAAEVFGEIRERKNKS